MSEERKPLWPKAIEVVGGTGEYESGKTTFGLTICPGEETLYSHRRSCRDAEEAPKRLQTY
jgi:hypothetical protein